MQPQSIAHAIKNFSEIICNFQADKRGVHVHPLHPPCLRACESLIIFVTNRHKLFISFLPKYYINDQFLLNNSLSLKRVIKHDPEFSLRSYACTVAPAIDDLYQLITLEEVGSFQWIILFLLPFSESRESFRFPQKCDGWTDGVWPCIFFPHTFHLPLQIQVVQKRCYLWSMHNKPPIALSCRPHGLAAAAGNFVP